MSQETLRGTPTQPPLPSPPPGLLPPHPSPTPAAGKATVFSEVEMPLPEFGQSL